jgi:hypothetical protein
MVFALALAFLGRGHASIVDGKLIEKGDPLAKFTVRIFLPDGTCSGTLITRNIVLTAAHCVVDEDTKKIFQSVDGISVGFNAFEAERLESTSSIVIGAEKIVLDRGYLGTDSRAANIHYSESQTKNHDLALIRLEKDAPAAFKPIPLARREEITAYADTLLIAGYGREKAGDGSTSGRLKSAKLLLHTDDPGYARIWMNYGNGLGCNGDSGGPILIETPSEGYKLAGVMNTGNDACTEGSLAARVDDYSDFLETAMRRLGSSADGLFTVSQGKVPPRVARHSIWPSR